MKQINLMLVVLLCLLWSCACASDDNTTYQSTPPLSGKYLLSFHACDTSTTNCFNPMTHKTYIAQSDDGIGWSPVSGYAPYLGSVPDLIRRGDTLYVYNPGTVRRYRINTDTWEDPVPVSVRHADGRHEMFVDPSAVLDSNGKLVLFYLVGLPGQDPARCPQGQKSCTKVFRSATEVEGSDGSAFIVDPGNRAEISITSFETASDPDVFEDPSGFIMYISKGQDILALSSSDLRGNYTIVSKLPDGILARGSGSVPSGYYSAATKEYWTYVHSSREGISVIRRAAHSSLDRPIPDASFSTIISGSSFPGLGSSCMVESPGFAVNINRPSNVTNVTDSTLPE